MQNSIYPSNHKQYFDTSLFSCFIRLKEKKMNLMKGSYKII